MNSSDCTLSKMLKNLISAAIFVLVWVQAAAQLQPFLLLEKPGTSKRIRYYAGDEILFKMRDQPNFFTGVIAGFNDTSFYVGNRVPIALSEVEAIASRSKVAGIRGISRMAFAAIPVMVLLSAANNTFNTGRTPVVDKEVWTISGIFAVVGGAGLLYKGRRYRLDNRWRLIVVHH